jgi:hypothetical protein
MQPYRPHKGRPSVQLPAGIKRRARFIRGFCPGATAKAPLTALSRVRFGAQPVVDCPDLVGKTDRHCGAVAQVLRPGRLEGQVLVAVEHVEELLQTSGQQHLLESRIGMRARKLRFVNQMIHSRPVATS